MHGGPRAPRRGHPLSARGKGSGAGPSGQDRQRGVHYAHAVCAARRYPGRSSRVVAAAAYPGPRSAARRPAEAGRHHRRMGD
eukprot:814901-Lingulodinium_polyedra.AAC.1